MLSALAVFGRKYLFEIIAVICFLVFMGVVVYVVQNWCNHACRTAKVEAEEAKVALLTCTQAKEKEMAFYLEQRAEWQRQVDEQKAAIEKALKEKTEIVEQKRRSFNQIFKETKKNEASIKQRVEANVRPSDVVVAPLGLVREYNAAVASGPGAAKGDSGSQVEGADPVGTLGTAGTFEALAVAEALIGNVLKYNELSARCTSLMELVKELENARK